MAKINTDPVLKGTNFPEKIIQSFEPPAYSVLTKQDNGDGTFSFVSDISLLINQRSLVDRIGVDNVRRMMNEFNVPQGSAFDKFRKGLSDSELLRLVKPRNIQTPAELSDWFSYLSHQEEALAALQKSDVDKPDSETETSADTATTTE